MLVSNISELLLDSQLFTCEFFIPLYLYCYISETSSFVYSSFMITNICILLPPCISILYHGHRQWQQKGSSFLGAMSHSDCFTYHLVTMELIGLSGCAVVCSGIYRMDLYMLAVGNYIFDFAWFGEISFHVLTCVERYLAAVHPITYLNLRTERGVRIRNITISCVWLFCLVEIGLEMLKIFPIIIICLLFLFLTAASCCSLSVLCVLIHPGPGDQGKGRERVDPSKQRAFITIVAILGVLVVKFSFNIIWELVYFSKFLKACLILSCFSWLNLPCSLVLPLLFLHRAGKLLCRKTSIK